MLTHIKKLTASDAYSKIISTLPVVAVLTLAAGLRLYHLGFAPLDWDERLVVYLRGMTIFWKQETYVHTWFAHLMIWITGSRAAWIVRLPSVCAAVLGVWATYLAGRRLFDRQTALVGATLLAIAPFSLAYDQQVSHYPYFILGSMLSAFFLQNVMRERRWQAWRGFALSTLFNLNTHLSAYLVLAMEIFWIGSLRLPGWFAAMRDRQFPSFVRNTRRIRSLTLVCIMILLVVPFLTAFLSHRFTLIPRLIYGMFAVGLIWSGYPLVRGWLAAATTWRRSWQIFATGAILFALTALMIISSFALSGRIRWILKITMHAPVYTPPPVWELLESGFKTFTGAPVLWLPFCVLAVVGWLHACRTRRPVAFLLFCWLLLPWTVLYLPTGHPYWHRYMMFMLPMYLLTVAFGLTTLSALAVALLRRINRAIPTRVAATGLTCAALIMIGQAQAPRLSYRYWQQTPGQVLSRFMREQVADGDLILMFGDLWSVQFNTPQLSKSIRVGQQASVAEVRQFAEQTQAGVWIMIDRRRPQYQALFPERGAPIADPELQAYFEYQNYARIDVRQHVIFYRHQGHWSASQADAAERALITHAMEIERDPEALSYYRALLRQREEHAERK